MKHNKQLAIIATAIGLSAAPAFAAKIAWHDDYRTQGGGEFTLIGTGYDLSGYSDDTKNILQPGSFQTFCIEKNQTIGNGWYVDVDLSTGAIAGGAGGPSPDPVSRGTAYLYSLFAKGELDTSSGGYDYTPGGNRQTAAGNLQNTIWFLEQEIGGTIPTTYEAMLNLEFGDVATAMLDQGPGNNYGVSAANLTQSNGTIDRQDQLYYQPGASPTNLPDGGATVMLLGLALGGFGTVRFLTSKSKRS